MLLLKTVLLLQAGGCVPITAAGQHLPHQQVGYSVPEKQLSSHALHTYKLIGTQFVHCSTALPTVQERAAAGDPAGGEKRETASCLLCSSHLASCPPFLSSCDCALCLPLCTGAAAGAAAGAARLLAHHRTVISHFESHGDRSPYTCLPVACISISCVLATYIALGAMQLRLRAAQGAGRQLCAGERWTDRPLKLAYWKAPTHHNPVKQHDVRRQTGTPTGTRSCTTGFNCS